MAKLRLQYDLQAVGLNQLRRTMRSVEGEIMASARRTEARVGARRGGGGSTSAKQETRALVREAKKALREQERAEKQRTRAAERESAKRQRIAKREWDAKVREARRAARQQVAIETKAAKQARAAIERERRARGRTVSSMRRGVARGTANTIRGVGRAAIGGAALLGGFAATNAVQERLGSLTVAQGIANRAAVVEGETRSREQIKTGVFGQTEEISKRSGRGQAGLLEGLDRFAIKTGDINAGQKLLPQLANLADAMGMTEDGFGQLAEASGIMFAGLKAQGKATDEAIKSTLDLAKVQAAQSAVGQIGTEDLARLAPVFLAAASRFTGDQGQNLATVTGLANISVATASASPEEAATAVSRFTDDLIKNADKLSKKFGIQVKDESGKIKGFEEILPQLIQKSGGSVFGLKKMGFGVRGLRAIEPLVNLFSEKGKGVEGQAAVDALLKKFTGVSLTDQQIQQGAAATQGSEQRKIAKAMDELNRAIATDLVPVLINDFLPALKEVAPIVGDLTSAFTDVVRFLKENPFTGLGAALAAILGKEMLKAGIGNVIQQSMSQSVGTKGLTFSGPASMAITGAATMITAAAVTATIAEFNQLDKETAGSATATGNKVLSTLPGFDANGDFSLGRLAEDVATSNAELTSNPLGFLERKFKDAQGAEGHLRNFFSGRDADARMNVQARENAAGRDPVEFDLEKAAAAEKVSEAQREAAQKQIDAAEKNLEAMGTLGETLKRLNPLFGGQSPVAP